MRDLAEYAVVDDSVAYPIFSCVIYLVFNGFCFLELSASAKGMKKCQPDWFRQALLNQGNWVLLHLARLDC